MPSCFAAGGSLAGSHSAFFLSLSAPLSATVDRQITAATRALRIVPMPRCRRTQFVIRLFMGAFQPKKAAASKTIAVDSIAAVLDLVPVGRELEFCAVVGIVATDAINLFEFEVRP